MTSKLFWSDSTVWYQVSNNWWDRQKFNFPTYVDVEFAKQTTQVEINIMLDREFAVQDLDHNDWLRLERSKRINAFWLAVRRSFPAARRVIVGTTRQIQDKSSEEYNIATLLHVLQRAPRDIHAFIASRQGPISRKQRMLWSMDTLATPQSQSITTFWVPKRVIMPVRQLSTGPLRDFMLMCKAKHLLRLEQRGHQRLVDKTHISYPIDTQRPKILYVLLPS